MSPDRDGSFTGRAAEVVAAGRKDTREGSCQILLRYCQKHFPYNSPSHRSFAFMGQGNSSAGDGDAKAYIVTIWARSHADASGQQAYSYTSAQSFRRMYCPSGFSPAFLRVHCTREQAEQLVQTRVCVQSSNRSGIINVLQLGCATTLHSKHYRAMKECEGRPASSHIGRRGLRAVAADGGFTKLLGCQGDQEEPVAQIKD